MYTSTDQKEGMILMAGLETMQMTLFSNFFRTQMDHYHIYGVRLFQWGHIVNQNHRMSK